MTCTFEDDQSGAHVLVHRVADDFVLPFQVIDAVLRENQNSSLKQGFPTWGTRPPRGTPEVGRGDAKF
jgi:hypothetical protein